MTYIEKLKCLIKQVNNLINFKPKLKFDSVTRTLTATFTNGKIAKVVIPGGSENEDDEDNFIKNYYHTYYNTIPTLTELVNKINEGTTFSIGKHDIFLITVVPGYHLDILGYIPEVKKYLLLNRGKGEYGFEGIPIESGDLELVYHQKMVIGDILTLPTTQYFYLGEVGESALISEVINLDEDITIQEQSIGYRVFKILRSGVETTYIFLAPGGIYGITGDLIATEEDFEPFQNVSNLGVMSSDFVIALSGGKNYGKYLSGQTVPCAGWSFEKTIKDIGQEALEPTVTLTSPTTVKFNQTAINNVLNFTKTINSLGASVVSVKLEWKRSNENVWNTLTNDSLLNTFTHSITDTNFNANEFNYRYTVVDSSGATGTVSLLIQTEAYVSPTKTDPIVSSTKELGNVSNNLSSRVSRQSSNVNLLSYKFQRSVDQLGWTDITESIAFLNTSLDTVSFVDSTAPLNSNSISYRIEVVDTYQTSYSTAKTIEYVVKSFLGYSSSLVLTVPQILSLENSLLTNGKARTIDPVTAGVDLYTYYVYNSNAGNLTNIILVTTPILGAFTKLADVTGVNSFGAAVTYRVYKSNATKSFTNDKLIIT